MGNSISKQLCDNTICQKLCSCNTILDGCSDLIRKYNIQTPIDIEKMDSKPVQVVDSNYMKRVYY